MLKASCAATALSLSCVSVLLSFVIPAVAQDSGCYMRTASGKMINLSRLCQSQGGAASGFTPAPTAQHGVFQVPIKRRHHGIPVLDVTFNGNQTVEMMMDVGQV